jgi:hypothetical protein
MDPEHIWKHDNALFDAFIGAPGPSTLYQIDWHDEGHGWVSMFPSSWTDPDLEGRLGLDGTHFQADFKQLKQLFEYRDLIYLGLTSAPWGNIEYVRDPKRTPTKKLRRYSTSIADNMYCREESFNDAEVYMDKFCFKEPCP